MGIVGIAMFALVWYGLHELLLSLIVSYGVPYQLLRSPLPDVITAAIAFYIAKIIVGAVLRHETAPES